jgi:CAAX protease family protein
MEGIDQPDSHFRPRPAAPLGPTSVGPPGVPANAMLPDTPAPVPDVDPRLNWRVGLLGIALAIGFVVLLGIAFAIVVAAGADADSHGVVFGVSLVQDATLLAAAILAVRTVIPRPTAETFGLRPFKASAVLWVLAGLGAFFVFSIIYSVIFHPKPQDIDQQLGKALTAVFAILIAPPVEEFFFRGFLYRSLRNGWGVAWAAIVSGLLFGAVHFEPQFLIPLAGLGVASALVYEKTKSLWPCIMLHATWNTIVVLATLGS